METLWRQLASTPGFRNALRLADKTRQRLIFVWKMRAALICLGPLYLVGLVLVCLFILSDGSGVGAHSDVEPVPAEKRRIFQFFP